MISFVPHTPSSQRLLRFCCQLPFMERMLSAPSPRLSQLIFIQSYDICAVIVLIL